MIDYLKTILADKGAGRMKEAAIIGLVLLLIISMFAPGRAGTVMSKLSMITIAASAGYWIDRTAFRADRRPHLLLGPERTHAEYRRAVVMGAAMLAMALGL